MINGKIFRMNDFDITQEEFNEYVLDESQFSTSAKISNSYYLS